MFADIDYLSGLSIFDTYRVLEDSNDHDSEFAGYSLIFLRLLLCITIGILICAIATEIILNTYYYCTEKQRYEELDDVFSNWNYCRLRNNFKMYSNGCITVIFYVCLIICFFLWIILLPKLVKLTDKKPSTGAYLNICGYSLHLINFISLCILKEKPINDNLFNGIPVHIINM